MKTLTWKKATLFIAVVSAVVMLYYNYNMSYTPSPTGLVVENIKNNGEFYWQLPQAKVLPTARCELSATVVSLEKMTAKDLKLLKPIVLTAKWTDQSGETSVETFRVIPHWRDDKLRAKMDNVTAGSNVELDGYMVKVLSDEPDGEATEPDLNDFYFYVTSIIKS